MKIRALYVPPSGHRPARHTVEVEAEDLQGALEEMARRAPVGWLRVYLEAC